MLVLETAQDNSLTIAHAKSGTKITMYYRDPETAEVVKYHNSSVIRTKKTTKINVVENRLAGGLACLTGFEDGVLGRRNKVGEVVAVSTDPKSADYYEGWKDLAQKHLAAEIMLLGAHIFESSRVTAEEEEDAEKN